MLSGAHEYRYLWKHMAKNTDIDNAAVVKVQKLNRSENNNTTKRVIMALLTDGWVYQRIDFISPDGVTTLGEWEALHKREPDLSTQQFLDWTQSHGFSKV